MTVTTYPSSKGPILISAMPFPHLNNAIAKLGREGDFGEVYQALIAERDRRPAPIGDNNPPEPIMAPISVITEAPPAQPTTFVGIKGRIEDLLTEARNWIDGAPITTQAQADEVARLKGMIRDAAAQAEALRVAENKPFDDGKAEVQGRYNPLIADTKTVKGSATLALDAIGSALTKWLTKLDDERRAEAAKLRAAAEEAQRAAFVASAEAHPDSGLEAQEAREAAITAARIAERAANRAETARPAAVGAARATTLRTTWVPVMVDENAALAHFWRTHRAPLLELAMTLAKAEVAAGKRSIPGFTITEERKAV